jgi:hypothetical protein
MRFPSLLALSAVFAATSVACGSRGPLDIDGPLVLADASADGAADAAALADAGADGDAARRPSILDCGLCVTQKCGTKVARCVQDNACGKALQCVAQKCLLGGFDLQCLSGCTGGDPQTALKAFEIAQCVTGVCGESCTAGLPLGILGGGG